jgi:hypothetical protein
VADGRGASTAKYSVPDSIRCRRQGCGCGWQGYRRLGASCNRGFGGGIMIGQGVGGREGEEEDSAGPLGVT